MTITLAAIKAEQSKIAEMIAAFEAQAAEKSERYHFPETLITLQPGEHYAGLILGKDGESSYHLVLLPGEEEAINWKDAKEWAGKQGCEYEASLPTRREQPLLFANLPEQFKSAWYWSSEQHAAIPDCAWRQYFGNGLQDYDATNDKCRARAVRRLIVGG